MLVLTMKSFRAPLQDENKQKNKVHFHTNEIKQIQAEMQWGATP